MTAQHKADSIPVITEPNCGNAPRHEITRRFAAALATADADELHLLVSPQVSWSLLGEGEVEGLSALQDRAAQAPQADELRVLSVITHGREASIDGELLLAEGTAVNFCHVLRFANTAKTALITGIRTYLAHG